jgi:diamine N-acetyltransferase
VPDAGDAYALVAYAQLRAGPAPAAVRAARPMEIARFYVDRPWHGHGLAPLLMRAALRTACTHGADAVWLQVWSGNARAIAFYRRTGFTFVGTQTFRFGSIDDDDHLMARPIVPDDGA